MKLFEIGYGEYVNIEFIVYVHENDRQIEMINGDKIHMNPMLFNELLNTLHPSILNYDKRQTDNSK